MTALVAFQLSFADEMVKLFTNNPPGPVHPVVEIVVKYAEGDQGLNVTDPAEFGQPNLTCHSYIVDGLKPVRLALNVAVDPDNQALVPTTR